MRQTPRFDDELADRTGDALDDHDLLEELEWDGGAPTAVTGVEIVRSRLTRLRLTGLELADDDDDPPDLVDEVPRSST